MVWAGFVDGQMLPLHFFVEDGVSVSVTSDRYLSMINEVIWPVLRDHPLITELFWQQDGALAHSSNVVLASLRKKFPVRVISRKGDIVWLLYADDATLFDSYTDRSGPNSRSNLCSRLDADLLSFESWGAKWLVNFNAHKTKDLQHSRLHCEAMPDLTMSNIEIRRVSSSSI